MRSIDKGDVEIKKLFRWNKSIKITVYGREVELFMRVVGDAELNRAKVHALRRSAELRRKLNDPESDERLAFIPDYDLINEQELINGLLTLSVREIMSTANNEVNIPLPAEPDSEASLEEQEEYQMKLDEYPIQRENAIKNYTEQRLALEEKKFREWDKRNLYDTYLRMAINQLCEIEMLTAFREMCTYLSIYMDDKFTHPLFDSLDEFRNLPTDIKNNLVQDYIDLDIDGEVLKKSLAVTQ